MNPAERRIKLFDKLTKDKFINVNEIAKEFNVSTMTIRRDLARLEKQGIVTTNYGGATFNEGVSTEPSFHVKEGYSQQSKVKIAYEASLLVNDGDSVFIDCGTTTREMIPFITNKKITIISNSWRIIPEIHDFSKIKVIMTPGEYDPVSEGTLSATTIDFLKNYSIDKAFISTQGVDMDFGVSVPTDIDAKVKKAIMNCAKYKILLADHTKWQETYLARHGKLEDFDVILTDEGLDRQLLEKLRDKKINIVLCNSYQSKENE